MNRQPADMNPSQFCSEGGSLIPATLQEIHTTQHLQPLKVSINLPSFLKYWPGSGTNQYLQKLVRTFIYYGYTTRCFLRRGRLHFSTSQSISFEICEVTPNVDGVPLLCFKKLNHEILLRPRQNLQRWH